MRILITGGAGFIGSHLCEFLLEEGHEVICLDNMTSGTKSNIDEFFYHENFTFHDHDVTEYIHVHGNLDWVLHLASLASPVFYQDYPIKTLKVGALGTHKSLGVAKAKDAKYLFASTSEVYGDPEVHPQPEDYWGNVNPVGARSCYDESKRYGEAITMAYHEKHGIDTRIARIFNSVLGDQRAVFMNDEDLHTKSFDNQDFCNIESDKILVPCFDPDTFKMDVRKASSIIKHPHNGDAFEVKTKYGRKVKVTGDHSIFRKNDNDEPEPVPVRDIEEGDYVAIPSKLPVVEKDINKLNIANELIERLEEERLWKFSIVSEKLEKEIKERKGDIYNVFEETGRYGDTSRQFFSEHKGFEEHGQIPLRILKALDIEVPNDAVIKPFTSGPSSSIPNRIELSNDLLWLIGFFVAEGHARKQENKDHYLTFSSDIEYLEKAKKIIEKVFDLEPSYVEPSEERAPSIYVHSKVLYEIFVSILELYPDSSEKQRIPSWVIQLPLSRLKHFMKGLVDGDGYRKGKEKLSISTVSKRLIEDLSYAFLRFGLVGSIGQYETTYKEKYGEKKFPFYKITLPKLSDNNPLNWENVEQKLNSKKTGDLVWARVEEINKCKSTDYVYDFSVPGTQNFVSGNGVCCHNTYGPRMRPDDGRVIPTFIVQALENKPLTVYGDGSQTRSFCYIDDLIEGIWKLMNSSIKDPVNLGNPDEISILKLAEKIINLTDSESGVTYEPLPEDDPERRKPDISKAHGLLEWQPEIGLEEGLEKTVDYFEEL